MRAYPTNSPEALARLIAMAILADGRLDNREIDWLKHHDTVSLVGIEQDVLIQALLDCCRDVITEAERTGKPSDLFWPWFAANVSVFGMSYAALHTCGGSRVSPPPTRSMRSR